MLSILLAGLLSLSSLVTVMWDANSPDDEVTATGYAIFVWSPDNPVWRAYMDVGTVTTAKVELQPGEQVAVIAYHDDLVMSAALGAPPIVVRRLVSYPSLRVIAPALGPNDPLCVPPLGAESISMFVFGYTSTTGVPGSRMNVRFQITSKSRLRKIVARLDGVDVTSPAAGNDLYGLSFNTPATGTHSLTIYAENAYGCQRETLSARPVTVQ